MTEHDTTNWKTATRRGALKAGAVGAALLAGAGSIGTVAAKGRNARTVLHPTYAGLQSGAVGSDDAHTLSGSWQTNVSNSQKEDTGSKLQLYLAPGDLFTHAGDVTIDDLTHVSYYTKKGTETSGTHPYNVYLQIYTEPDGVDDKASWYGYRLTAEPYFAESLDAPGGEWVQWSTTSGDNQLTFFDDSYVGYGFYGGQPTLGELQSGSIDWSARKSGAPSTNIDYGSEVIKYVTFQTGSGYPSDVTPLLDTIEVGVDASAGRGRGSDNGQVARIDLEP